jgi:hypothetical protein
MAVGSITNFSNHAMEAQMGIQNLSLSRAVANGSLNKEEFLDLNQEQNSLVQLRDTFTRSGGGISPEEQQILDARNLAYASKLDQYREGDFKPAVASANPYDKAQNEQAGKIFDGIREGTVDHLESGLLLQQQRNIARGSLERKPNEQQQLLNESEFEIQLARRDSKPSTPPANPWPTPPPFGGFPGGGLLPGLQPPINNKFPAFPSPLETKPPVSFYF